MFEKLESRYFFTGEIVLQNELHIGSGRGNGQTDALVMADHSGNPFIPGSSLRGALRSTIERIFAAIGGQPCLLIKDNPCVSTSIALQEEFKNLLPTAVNAFLCNPAKVCPVCRLFGSTVVASKLRFTDLSRVNGSTLAIRDSVAIDRDTGTAKDGAKFDFQTVSKDVKFKFEIIGENLSPFDLGLIAIGIQELKDGNFWLGGNSARGLGKCKLEGLDIKFFSGADGLRKYLRKEPLANVTETVFLSHIDRVLASEAPTC